MGKATFEEDRLKELVKKALGEVFEEKKDLMRDLFEEVLEDFALARAIEEGEDLSAFKERKDEPDLLFEDVVSDLKSRGKL